MRGLRLREGHCRPSDRDGRMAPGGDQSGIGLLELMLVLLALMGLALALSYKTSDAFSRQKSLDTAVLLDMADHQLRQFIVQNGRLPCPSSGDGQENCSLTQKGYLPYKTLGLTEVGYTPGEVQMLYGVYRVGTLDFTRNTRVFNPQYLDAEDQLTSLWDPASAHERNTFDFCAQLGTLRAQAYAGSGLNVGLPAGSSPSRANAVYALAVPGVGNLDATVPTVLGGALNGQYDGVNATDATAFEAPQRPVGPDYDDRTRYRSAGDLHDYYRCESMNQSIQLLVESLQLYEQLRDMAQANADAVSAGVTANIVQSAIAAWAVIQSVAAIASAAEVLSISSALLATVSATCPIPPWVTCALIPVYSTAVSFATAGVVAAALTTALAATQLGLAVTATVLYDQLQGRVAVPAAPSTQPGAVDASAETRLQNLAADYRTKLAAAKQLYVLAAQSPVDTVDNLKLAQETALAAVVTKIDAVMPAAATPNDPTDPANILEGALKNRLSGLIEENCTPGTTGCVGYTYTDQNGNTQTKYLREVVAGVTPAIQAYRDAQAGVTTGVSAPDANGNVQTVSLVDSSYATMVARESAYKALLDATRAFAVADQNYLTLDPGRSQSATLATWYTTNQSNLDRWWAAKQALLADPTNPTKITEYNAALAALGGTEPTAVQASWYQRAGALTTLRTALGDNTWDYTGSTPMCGGDCSWMGNTSAAGVPTGSTLVNAHLDAFDDWIVAKNEAAYDSQAAAAANVAWTARSSYKGEWCSRKENRLYQPPATPSQPSPSLWDPSGDNFSIYAPDLNPVTNCGSLIQISTSTPDRSNASTVRDPSSIIADIIRKGIAK